MTALLDTPLPQLHPLARPVRSGVTTSQLTATSRAVSARTAPAADATVDAPVNPPPDRAVTPLRPADPSRGASGLWPALPPERATSLWSPAQAPLPANPRHLPPHRQQPSQAPRASAPAHPAAGRRQPVPDTSVRSALRLTRRARLAVTLATTLSLLAIVGLAMLNAAPTRGELRDAPASVVVQTGDTLWQIAVDVAPAEDPVAVVELLRSANDLDRTALRPGQILVIPRG